MSMITSVIHREPLSASLDRDACIVQLYPTGPGMGVRHRLAKRSVIIGRGSDCDIYISDDSVSRRHARIYPTRNGFFAEDLKSTNGTFVNRQQVTESRIADGDYLQVGNCIFRFLAGSNIEQEYYEEIYRLTILDALTDIHNKRYLEEFLDRELARSIRYRRPLSLIMFDVDHFKSINDRIGHLGGDFTLREVASLIKQTVRREELFARYGGEEFAIVLPETTLNESVEVAERIRRRVQTHLFEFESKSFSLTVSLGVTSTMGDRPITFVDLFREADQNLYKAKQSGRNRVIW
ncbi:MAG: GGDEF domain-containing protein [Planctomycetia bacterium]|nr:GGDEF domain-containing protein [Planctomycetia bacterium]